MNEALTTRLREALPGHTIERELGGGGMSTVFLARQDALGRRVVIKVVSATGVTMDAARFRREVLLSARLQHPHIVPVLVAGEVDGLPFFVMPFVEGESLRARLRRAGALPAAEAIRLLRNVAAALAYAHDRGIVHRDIKPDNIIVSGGVAVVLDFGVAKALADSALVQREGATTAGLAVGTPAYMSPEQAAADPDVDARADLYAFGVLAYELVSGATPFAGREPAQMLRAHLMEEPAPIMSRSGGLPGAVAAAIMRCLAKDRAARPQSANEVLELLDAMATPRGTPGAIMRESVVRAWSGTLPAVVPALVYAAACAITLFGIRWLSSQGLVANRVFVVTLLGSLMGLPIVVAAGLVHRVRAVEHQRRKPAIVGQ